MSLPAKPARHSWHARIAYRPDVRESPPAAERPPCRVCLVCRAGSAGRGMAVACATLRLMSTFPPTQDAVLGRFLLCHRGGGVLLPVAPQRAVVLAGVPQVLRVLDQVLEDHLPVEVHAEREVR